MRKRRCFADKEVEAAMFERERQIELQKCKPHLPSPPSTTCPSFSQSAAAKEVLQRIFPTHNPSVLELVWQGCGGNIERAIERVASGISSVGYPVSKCASATQENLRKGILAAHIPLQYYWHWMHYKAQMPNLGISTDTHTALNYRLDEGQDIHKQFPIILDSQRETQRLPPSFETRKSEPTHCEQKQSLSSSTSKSSIKFSIESIMAK